MGSKDGRRESGMVVQSGRGEGERKRRAMLCGGRRFVVIAVVV